MGAFIVKQPNGRYMRFSSTVDCPTHWNMTEEDYIKVCEERAREEALDILKHHCALLLRFVYILRRIT